MNNVCLPTVDVQISSELETSTRVVYYHGNMSNVSPRSAFMHHHIAAPSSSPSHAAFMHHHHHTVIIHMQSSCSYWIMDNALATCVISRWFGRVKLPGNTKFIPPLCLLQLQHCSLASIHLFYIHTWTCSDFNCFWATGSGTDGFLYP